MLVSTRDKFFDLLSAGPKFRERSKIIMTLRRPILGMKMIITFPLESEVWLIQL